jgi:alpha-L-arabinofuranosidase
MFTATVTNSGRTSRIAPSELLGHNLELAFAAHSALLSDRLENPKFSGPANPQTGIAKGWRTPTSNYMGISYELVSGEGIMGSEAQIIQSTSNRGGKGLLQPGRWFRSGERLEVILWARAIHTPATLRVGIRPNTTATPDYASAEILLRSACWQEYRVILEATADTDNGVFFIWLEKTGLVEIDQVHLRTVGSAIVRQDVLSALKAFQMPLLRFPGGCITTAYHWRFGTGPNHLRPVHLDPVFKSDMSYDFGTDEYLEFCSNAGITPVVCLNIGTGTPTEAAEWATYCADWFRSRGRELPLIYWQLGNEQDGYWERSHMNGEMYAEVIKEMVPGIRKAYPNSKIAALGPEKGFCLDTGKQPWRQTLLDVAGDLIDVIALQLYAIVPTNPDAAIQHANVLQSADRNAKTLSEAAEDCKRRGLPVRVALSEWNLWLHASHFDPEGFVEPMDIQHGLFASAMFHHLARQSPEMAYAAMYQIIGCMNTFAIKGPEVKATHMADIFSLYRPAFPGEVLDLTTESPQAVPEVAAVDALALLRDSDTWIFLSNRSLTDTAAVALNGFGSQPEEGLTLSGSDPLDCQASRTPARFNGNSIELPPLSVTRLRYRN